jgi:hypothetical protein
MIVESLGIRRDPLKSGTHFTADLRVPPGEFHTFLEDVQDEFGVLIESRKIRTVGDLLNLIEPPSG